MQRYMRKQLEITEMEKREFARRRKRLMDRAESGSIIIQPNAPEKIRNRDVYYPYRADSDFYYLTGFPEPESLKSAAGASYFHQFLRQI